MKDFAKFPVGRTFLYLGGTMVVASNTQRCPFGHHGPRLVAEYRDSNGVIREKTFESELLDLLLADELP